MQVAAYKDPDGFVVYLIVFHLPLAPIFWAARAWNRVHDPQLFHWTINVPRGGFPSMARDRIPSDMFDTPRFSSELGKKATT